jgi:hypothetical protein
MRADGGSVRRGATLGRGPLLALLTVLLLTRCDTLHPEELDCEDAVAYLQKCCPTLPSSSIQCVYDQQLDPGADDGCWSVNKTPDFPEPVSQCIRSLTCDDLVEDGICAAATSDSLGICGAVGPCGSYDSCEQ